MGGAAGSGVTPVEKVITLLEDLKAELETEGAEEGKAYDEFACFCKSSHEEKTRSIEELEASVASLSAEYRPSLEIYWSIASA